MCIEKLFEKEKLFDNNYNKSRNFEQQSKVKNFDSQKNLLNIHRRLDSFEPHELQKSNRACDQNYFHIGGNGVSFVNVVK